MSEAEGMFVDGKFYENPAKIYIKQQEQVPQKLNTDGSNIVEFFKGKSVFLTGATGFFGKSIMEKLLRACVDIDSIFVLGREKKGKDIHTRLDDVFNDPLFANLSKINPKFRHKVTVIKGDMTLPGLGLSIEDRLMLTSKVNVIFHCAATVRFDEPLRKAFEINVQGAKRMLILGKECKNLESYIHVSTAYSHCIRTEIDEQFYPTSVSIEELEELLKTHTEEELELKTSSILCEWPNTYTFTKALIENWVKENSQGFPVAVFRPSIVVSTYKEPIRGWTDNIYGPAGITLGAGMGILRTLHCKGDSVADIVPVDMVVNALISIAYKTSQEKTIEPKIYNYVSSVQQPTTWDEYMKYNSLYGTQVPTVQTYWYYNLRLCRYYICDLFYQLVLHFLPALIVDAVSIMIGKKPQLFKVYKKIYKFSRVITFFSNRQWNFKNDNVQKLWYKLSDVDQNIFPFDISEISWEYHSQMNLMGLRTYILKEDVSTVKQALPKWKILKVIDNAIKYIVIFIALRILYGVILGALQFLN